MVVILAYTAKYVECTSPNREDALDTLNRRHYTGQKKNLISYRLPGKHCKVEVYATKVSRVASLGKWL